MRTRVDIERIIKKVEKRIAKGQLTNSGVVVVNSSDDNNFLAGQRVRVLVDTKIPVMNSITGEQIGNRKQTIGNGTVQIRNSQVRVVMDNVLSGIKKNDNYRVLPLYGTPKKYTVSLNSKAEQPSREVYVQEILE